MDKRTKYNLRQKLLTVRSITSGRESCLSAAKKIGSRENTVQRWLRLYKQHGAKGLTLRNGSYDGHFKLRVVRYLLKKGISVSRAAVIFAIPQDPVVGKWLKIYKRCGANGLLREARGRKRTQMPRKKLTQRKTSKETGSPEDTLAALQKELDYLRAENAFLKKLEALTQQEEAAKERSRRQKPSRS